MGILILSDGEIQNLVVEKTKINDVQIQLSEKHVRLKIAVEYEDKTYQNLYCYDFDKSILTVLKKLMEFCEVDNMTKLIGKTIKVDHDYTNVYALGHPDKDLWVKIRSNQN